MTKQEFIQYYADGLTKLLPDSSVEAVEHGIIVKRGSVVELGWVIECPNPDTCTVEDCKGWVMAQVTPVDIR